ncbi:MAG TPA: MarR family transcriptional regulator [Usitatibacter sp.]|nr:MarR family transcriptional regulator [Usitatibacter sp.]
MGIYEPETFDIRSAVPPLVGRVRAAFMNALDGRLAPFDIRSADYLVLVALANDIADTASSVCSLIAHDPGAMTRKIDALEARGLVKRARSAEDRRAVRLELTAEGRRLYPKMRETAVAMANEFLRGFTKAEVRELEAMLKRILDNAESLEREPEPAKEARR